MGAWIETHYECPGSSDGTRRSLMGAWIETEPQKDSLQA